MANLHRSPSIVIVGAGIAGVATAYHLAVKRGVRDVLLVDSRPPLSLTSDKSTEAYRNWWPGPDGAMVGLMNRSIDLLEALSDAAFRPERWAEAAYRQQWEAAAGEEWTL